MNYEEKFEELYKEFSEHQFKEANIEIGERILTKQEYLYLYRKRVENLFKQFIDYQVKKASEEIVKKMLEKEVKKNNEKILHRGLKK